MGIKQDKHGFHRDEKGRFIGRKEYNEHLKKVNVDLTKLTKAIPMGRIGTLLGNSLLKGLSKVFKTIRANRMLLFTAFVTPLTKALKAVKGIFGFMSKLANLTFNSIIKLFGLLWVWSKLGSLGGLNELSQAGHGGGGTGGGSQAAQRADTTFGTTHYSHLYNNIQNMANNPSMWGHFARLGFTNEEVKRFGTQDPSLSIREFEQGIFRRAKEIGGFTSYQAPSIIGSGLSGLGMDMANFRGVYERGISGEQEKYFKSQLKNTSALEKMEREYTKLQYEFTDLWRHFAVSLGPTMMKISKIFINFGHRLAKFLGTNDNMEKALDGLYKITERVFEWLGTKGFEYVDKFFSWFDKEGLPLLKQGWEWLKEFISSASKKWNEWGGLDGVIAKIKDEFNYLKEALGPTIEVIKKLGSAVKFVIDTFADTLEALVNWTPIKKALEALGITADLYAAGFAKLRGDDKTANAIYHRMYSVTNNKSDADFERVKKMALPSYDINTIHSNPLPSNLKGFENKIKSAQVEQQAIRMTGDATLTINIGDVKKTVNVNDLFEFYSNDNNKLGGGN